MTKETRGNNRNGRQQGRRRDPNQDVQPWLGWVAAALVVVIIVVAVAMGMERTNNQRSSAAEVRMTPLVGGMAMPVATEEDSGVTTEVPEVTPVPEVMTETTTITDGAVTDGTVTDGTAVTGTDAVTGAGTITSTDTVTGADAVTSTEEVTTTGEITTTETVSPTADVTATEDMTGELTSELTETVAVTATNEVTVSVEVTAEATTEPTVAPSPTATTLPTATPTAVIRAFEPGDVVSGSEGRVAVYADASLEAMVMDSFGTGVALEVLGPSGDYTEYPVVADGHGWVRVRAADGLVGWVMTDQVEAQ